MATARKQRIEWTVPEKLVELAEFRYRLREFLSFSEAATEAVGISAQQYQLLQVIAAVPVGQERSISHVAERMLLRHNSAVELVDRAQRSGLVRRAADESDHRRSLLEITERGQQLLSLLVEEHLKEIEAKGPEMNRALQRLIGSRPKLSQKSSNR
ncbi:MAG TPA: MarR family transcriptional regulator [Edaphobacter sp.]|jgi:DNA-binding MarR family transcriptional regulator|nr:MarR family transcriptional regulator [Edaphobacter sp.]